MVLPWLLYLKRDIRFRIMYVVQGVLASFCHDASSGGLLCSTPLLTFCVGLLWDITSSASVSHQPCCEVHQCKLTEY